MSHDEKQQIPQQETIVAPSAENTHQMTLNRLKGSRVAIESFLDRYAESQTTRIDALGGIEWLDRIVGEATLGNFDNTEIESWMSRHSDLAESTTLSKQDRERISSLLLELQSNSSEIPTVAPENGASDGNDATDGMGAMNAIGAKELRKRFEMWKERSGSVNVTTDRQRVSEDFAKDIQPTTDVIKEKSLSVTQDATKNPPRKIILRRKSEKDDIGLFEKFTEQVWTELDLLYREFESGEHALTKLDDILKCAESKSDPMYLHLAGSLIYFLKIEGFRMAPYAERLRQAEKRFTGSVAP